VDRVDKVDVNRRRRVCSKEKVLVPHSFVPVPYAREWCDVVW
jgi:hypothetical protein